MKNIFALLLSFLIIGCTDDKKEKANNYNQCYNDKDIKYKYDSISFWFIKQYENIDLKNANISHIHEGKSLSLNYRYNQKDSKIFIKDIQNLVTEDTIKILLNNKTEFNIYHFRNGPIYGGKNFLGCVLSGYKVNNMKREDAMYGTITIY